MSWFKGSGHDPEGYRPPIPVRERLRLVLRAAVIVGAYLWFRARASDASHEGAAALAAFGVALAAIGLIELVVLRDSTDADRIFTSTKKQAAVLLVSMTVAGIVLATLGVVSGA